MILQDSIDLGLRSSSSIGQKRLYSNHIQFSSIEDGRKFYNQGLKVCFIIIQIFLYLLIWIILNLPIFSIFWYMSFLPEYLRESIETKTAEIIK